MKKYTLTEEHRAQLEPWKNRWLKNAMSTKTMDEAEKEICRNAVEGLYRAANLSPPPRHRIVFVPSPFVGIFAAGFAAAIWHIRKTGFKNSAATYAATDTATYAARSNPDGKRKWFSFGLSGMVRLSLELKLGEFGLACAQSAYRFYQGGKYELLLLDIGLPEKRPYLRMTNQSIGETHIEGVAPGTKTVKSALAWRNGMDEYVQPVALT